MDNVAAELSEPGSTLEMKEIPVDPTLEMTEIPVDQPPSEEKVHIVILYRRRWVILAIFCLCSMMNEVIWISLSSIASILTAYYQVGYFLVNWLAMIFALLYVTGALSVYIINRFGLRVTIILGALTNFISSALRLAGYKRNGFYLSLAGSAFGGFAQTFLIAIPPTLAFVWFGEKERARASAIGVLANILGVAVGFLLGSQIVPNSKDYNGDVKRGMLITLIIQAVACFLLLIAALLFTRKAPATPPTYSRHLSIKRSQSKAIIRQQSKTSIIRQQSKTSTVEESKKSSETGNGVAENITTQSTGFFKNWKLLATSIKFHLLLQAYGIYTGMFFTVSSLLNQMTHQYFPEKDQLTGIMGFSGVLCGLVAIMLTGLLIDKTHRYKLISVCVFIACTASFLLFVLVLKYSRSYAATFVCFCVYGVCSYPYVAAGFEYTTEIMYPVKESILASFLMLLSNLYGTLFTWGFGVVIEKYSSEVAGYIMTGIYFVGFICITFVTGELKRLKIEMAKPKH